MTDRATITETKAFAWDCLVKLERGAMASCRVYHGMVVIWNTQVRF